MPEPREDLKRTVGRLPLPAPPEWTERASCAQAGGDLWFPERGEDARAARHVCRECPVARECLAYAVGHDERDGVWGGVFFGNELERARARVPLGLPGKGAAA